MGDDTGIISIGESLGNERTRTCRMDHEFFLEKFPGGGLLRPLPIHHPADSIRDSFILEYEKLRGAFAETREFSYLCFVVNSRTRSVQAKVLRLEPGVFYDLIVGRHSQCGLVLREDWTVSLRQALVRLYLRPADLVPVFKILDLATETSLITVEGEKTNGLVGAGHCMLTVGEYHLYLVYNNDEALPEKPEEAWEALQPKEPLQRREDAFRAFDDVVSPDQVKLRSRQETEDAPTRNEHRTFSGTASLLRVLGPSFLEDPAVPSGPGVAVASLLLKCERTGLVHLVAVQGAQLRRGLLLGRYNRCGVGGTGLALPDLVSRVHLILLEDEGAYWAIDAASTNGCLVSTVPFSTRRLDGSTKILLGGEVTVEWIPASGADSAGA